MAEYRDFVEEVNLTLPGVARMIVEPVLKRTIDRFCEDGRAWVSDLGPVTVEQASVLDVATLLADQLANEEAVLVDVLALTLDGETLPREQFSRFARKGVELAEPISGEVVFRCTLKPGPHAAALPDHLYDNWRTEIAAGVAARLMMQPNQNWSDVAGAQYYKDQFERGCNKALFEANNQRDDAGQFKHNFYGGA